MIYEIAEIQIKPDAHADFEAAVREAVPLFRASPGCLSMRLERIIERQDTYHLVVGWETLEHHTVQFRGSEAFTAWRALVGPFFAVPPKVEHTQNALNGF